MTLDIEKNLDSINVLGRYTTNANGITADWSASGIEFKVNSMEAVKVSAVLDNGKSVQFRAFVNGVETGDITFTQSGEFVDIPGTSSLQKSEKTIRLVRVPYVLDGNITLSDLSIKGELLEWNEERLFIEFIGDSITCGYGSDPNAAVSFRDATKTFAYLTAEEYNADYSMVAISGIGLSVSNASHNGTNMADVYKYTNYNRSKSELYTTERKADLVVVNLNTNDIYNNATEAEYKSDLRSLISDIRSIHGENVNIVWIIGHMRPADHQVNSWLEEVFEADGSDNLYIIETEMNNEGGHSHPTYTSHQYTADLLTNFIESKGLLSK